MIHALWAIIRKEFRSYFNSPIACFFLAIFLAVVHWMFFRGFFIYNQADLRPLFSNLPFLLLFFIPAIGMRLWSEEWRLGTAEVLLTFPVPDEIVVLGKFIAGFLFWLTALALLLPTIWVMSSLGDIDFGVAWGGLIGAALLGAVNLSVALFASGITKHQIIAFLLSAMICFFLLIIGYPVVLASAPSSLHPLLSFLGLGTHFSNIGRGVIDSRDILYFFSLCVFFLYLNVRSIERGRG